MEAHGINLRFALSSFIHLHYQNHVLWPVGDLVTWKLEQLPTFEVDL